MKKTVLTTVFLALTTIGFSQNFTRGNLVISRYGDGGATALPGSNVAAPIYLDEYTKAGVLVQSLAMPIAISGANNPLTGNSGGSNEGLLTLSTDGTYLTLFGHGIVSGGTITNGATGTDRTIGTVTKNKTISTTITVGGASVVNPRCATTADGSTFYFVGSAGGVQSYSAGTFNTINTESASNRSVNIFNGKLYSITNASTAPHVANFGVTALPTTTTALTALPGLTTSPVQPNQVVFLSSTGTGDPDLMYVANDGKSGVSNGMLEKWVLSGGTWVAKGTVEITTDVTLTGFKAVTGYMAAGGMAKLYCMTGSKVFEVTDVAPTTATISIANNAPVSIITAATNTKLQGISFTPGTVVATLPISLSSFTGAVENDAVKLNWITASEKNNKNFSVLRSGEDKVFTQIGDVAGLGNSDSKKVYVFRDVNPLSGNNYYKLLQTDFNGNSEEFGSVVVSTNLSKESFNIYADKNEVKVTLSSLVSAKADVKIFDTNGSQLASESVTVEKGFNDFRIAVKGMKAGVYVVSLTSDGKNVSKKFIK